MDDTGVGGLELRPTPSAAGLSDQASGWRVEAAFRAGLARSGERAALEVGGREVSYLELDQRSNGLARRLLESGLGAGDVVALACQDVEQFAVGALAALKAGASYFAIDLRYPITRAPDALFSGAAKLLVGGRDLPEVLTAPGLPVLLDAFDAAAAPGCEPRPATGGPAAYVCFTSGTTGAPKGAMLPHAGIRALAEHPEFDGFFEGARIANCSTFAFDAVTFEVWGALLNGACLVDVPAAVKRSPWELAEFFSAARIDGTLLTTSLFNAVAGRRPDAFGGMQCLVIGGEAADPAYVGRVLASGSPPRRLVNAYGPTEATTVALCHTILPADVEGGEIPIGRPLSGRTIRLVREDGELAGSGEEGELCIGGEAVALGYLADPQLTAEKFVADPWADRPGARLYRTGDICRLRADGVMQYLGRADEQVKVRGFRVEPAGVAARLREIDGVADALVLPRPGAFGTKELVAFVRAEKVVEAGVLHEAAARRLPDYMLPRALHVVAEFPLKPNGKVDAAALLELSDLPPGAPPPAEEAARASLEERLLAIWRRHSRVSGFGLDTPYDEVCDSLATIGLMIEVEEAFGQRLSIADLEPPVTVRTMAAALAAPRRVEVDETVRAFYVSQPWNMRAAPEAIGRALGRGGPWLQLQVPASPVESGLYDSVEGMAAALEAQIRAVSDTGPFVLGGHSFGGVLAFELARRLEARGCAVDRLVLIDSAIARRRSVCGRLHVRVRQIAILCVSDWGRLASLAHRALRSAAGRAEPEPLGGEVRRRCIAAMQRYAPQPVDAPALLLKCSRYDHPFDRPQNSLRGVTLSWSALLPRLRVEAVDCTHAEIVRDPEPSARAAEHIRSELSGWVE